MPVKIVHPNHVEIMGFGHVLLASPPTAALLADLYTGQIAEEAALTSRAFAVIGKQARESSEPERPGSSIQEVRKSIEGVLAEEEIRYILEIVGKAETGVEVRMPGAKTCSDSTLELVRSRLERAFATTATDLQDGEQPNSLTEGCSRKDARGEFLLETVQVLFGNEERQLNKEKVISVVSEIADLLNGRVGPISTD